MGVLIINEKSRISVRLLPQILSRMMTHSTTTPWGCDKSRSFRLAVLDEGQVGSIRGVQSSMGGNAGRLRNPYELFSLLRALIDLLCDLDARLASWQVGRFGRCLLCTVGIVWIHVT